MDKQRTTTAGRLVYNSITNIVSLVSHAVIGFFMIRFLLGRLGEARYGVWVLVGGTLFRYAPLLSIGLNSSINRYIPVYFAQDNSDGIKRVVNTSLFFFTILSCAVALVCLVVYYNVESWFKIEPEHVKTAGILVLIVGFSLVFSLPLQLSTAILSGVQRYDLINLVYLFSLFSRTVLLIILLSLDYGLITVGIIYGLTEIVTKTLHSVFAVRLLPSVSLSAARIDSSLLKEMLIYGTNTFLYATGAVIIFQASTLIIGAFLGTIEVSHFFVATIAVFLLSQTVSAFTSVIKPAVSDLDARDEKGTVKEIALLTQKYSLLLIIPGGFFLVVMGSEFLTICFSDRFENPEAINSMAVVLAIITLAHCARLAQHSNFLVLVGRGQHKIFGAFTAVMAILCISASVVSVTVFDFGLLGIAWSNFIPMVLVSGIILPVYFNWKMRISTVECVGKVWWPAVLGSLPAVIMIACWKYLASLNTWFELTAVIIAAMVLTFIGGWFLGLNDDERTRFKRIALRRR